jgi:hypothetical protein
LRSRASRRPAEEEVAVVEEEAKLAAEEEVALAAEEEVALAAAEEQAGVDSERLAQLFEQAGVVEVSEVSTTPLPLLISALGQNPQISIARIFALDAD